MTAWMIAPISEEEEYSEEEESDDEGDAETDPKNLPFMSGKRKRIKEPGDDK